VHSLKVASNLIRALVYSAAGVASWAAFAIARARDASECPGAFARIRAFLGRYL
jgi:hypothetical protein